MMEMCLQKPNNLIKLHVDRSERAWLYFPTPSLSLPPMQALQALILDWVVLSSSLNPFGSASTVTRCSKYTTACLIKKHGCAAHSQQTHFLKNRSFSQTPARRKNGLSLGLYGDTVFRMDLPPQQPNRPACTKDAQLSAITPFTSFKELVNT